MKYSEQQLAILSAQRSNILAITSVCNVKCLFCSHQGNPSGVRTFSSGHRSFEEIEEVIEFILYLSLNLISDLDLRYQLK